VSQAFRQLIMTGTKAEELVSRLARRYGLTHASLNALAAIEAAGEPLPAGEISTRMHYTTGTMTGILDTLERKGYVRRIADPSDRRRVLVDITPQAQHLLDDIRTVLQAGVHALTAFDDTALRALLETLDAISKGIDAVPDNLPRRHRAGHRRSSGATADRDRPRHPHRTPATSRTVASARP
jgi:DNA-binding MarR family transcriptional regulator